jgi:phenylpropionate dioxygenase-like ring-hydroxylating dioxygenase large terminal subunit
MLSSADNDLLARTGPGTPLGSLMREYWIPALLSSELPGPDCDPVRTMLLGEKFIAFRDTAGEVGLLRNACPHRGASLFLGRNENSGLRCVYHGWKFAVDGRCLDMPSEPPDSTFKDRVRAQAYPCVERGGIVWTYLGPREAPPPLPQLEANNGPDGEWAVEAIQRECNWLQALEGDIDTSHFGFLHVGSLDPDDTQEDTFLRYIVTDRAPRYRVLDTEYGAMYGAYRPAGDSRYYWRIAHFLFPFYTMIPSGVLGLQRTTRAWVPLDDEHMMFYRMTRKARPSGYISPQQQLDTVTPRRPEMPPLIPNGTGWFDRFRLAANAENDYLIDRTRQREQDFTGIPGIFTQDQAVTESMEPIYDRTQEHLGSSDVMVIRVRRRVLAAIKRFHEDGAVPPGVDHPEIYRQRGGGIVLPQDSDWVAATERLRTSDVVPDELDPALSGGA